MNIAEKDLEVFLESLIVLIDKPNKGKTAAMRKFAYELLARKGVSYVHPRSVPANLKKDGKDFDNVPKLGMGTVVQVCFSSPDRPDLLACCIA